MPTHQPLMMVELSFSNSLVCHLVILSFLICEFQSHSWQGALDSFLTCELESRLWRDALASFLTRELESRLWRGALDTTYVCQLLAAGRWFSPGTLVFSTIVESGVKHHNPNPSFILREQNDGSF